MEVLLPFQALVVLVGPSGSGKTTWADEWFSPDQIVSSDKLRALVGVGEHDQRAGTDAFDVLDLVVERRMKRGLLTVIDSLGLDEARRQGWLATAKRYRRPAVAIRFDVAERECRKRNKARANPVPSKVLTSQLKRWPEVRAALDNEDFDAVHDPAPARVVAPPFLTSPANVSRQKEQPVPLRFGLQIPSFTWPGDNDAIAERLAAIAREAEEAGFSSIWVTDHFLQIPYVGREWEPMLDSYTTLGFLAAHTTDARLGVLVTGVTYRNVAHLGKIVATLDVLSGGRAACGLGTAWFEREHRAYGWDFPPVATRYELLEDALQVLPLLWGPGSPSFEGRHITVPEAICYPRPLQEHVPILVGGSGERRTLRLVARYADACNLFGEADTVRHKVAVLRQHCADVDRDPDEVRVTQLSSVTLEGSGDQRVLAGTVDDHIGRFRGLADAGLDEAIVSVGNAGDTGSIAAFAPVVEAFEA